MGKGKKICALALCGVLALGAIGFTGIKSNADDSNVAFVPTISATPSKEAEVNLLEGGILEYASNYTKLKSAKYLPEGYPNGYSSSGKKREDAYAPKSVTLTWESEAGAQYYTVKVATNQEL